MHENEKCAGLPTHLGMIPHLFDAIPVGYDDRHIGQLYELTDPRLLTFAEAVDEIGPGNRP